MSIEIITTADGSNSLLHTGLNETYHSVHGAIRESTHVFINHGLNEWMNRHPRRAIDLLEIGFGTGLNALLTQQEAEKSGIHVRYRAIEAFPLTWEVACKLNYPDMLGGGKVDFQKIHLSRWNFDEQVSDHFALAKLEGDAEHVDFGENRNDVVYFDAFSPSKQPELWTLAFLGKVVKSMKPGAVFVTYSAKGQLKRDLAVLGLRVETLPGPPGKLEMVRACQEA
jgi:tRNA U34 5-methylaminomethyl-2-thiouridine-forming methyltransferase MnmC